MSRLLESETLTLLVLLAIAVLAGYVLGNECKEILASVVSGLLGYLTKSAVTAYKAAVAPPPTLPPEEAKSKEA